MTYADRIPRIAGLGIDGRDRIWVGVSLETPGVAERLDVFSRDGEFLGSVAGVDRPDAFLGGDRATAILEDPNTGLQHVALLRLVEP